MHTECRRVVVSTLNLLHSLVAQELYEVGLSYLLSKEANTELSFVVSTPAVELIESSLSKHVFATAGDHGDLRLLRQLFVLEKLDERSLCERSELLLSRPSPVLFVVDGVLVLLDLGR